MEDRQENSFPATVPLYRTWVDPVIAWLGSQKILFEALLVAVSFHVIMFPVIWIAGWALPWPRPPVVTTIIEFDLDEWLKSGKPKKIFEFRDPKFNQ
jgi:hypothetical protein